MGEMEGTEGIIECHRASRIGLGGCLSVGEVGHLRRHTLLALRGIFVFSLLQDFNSFS
jgi:hypothetical protein